MKKTLTQTRVKADQKTCDYCGVCVAVCPENCIELQAADIEIIHSSCTRCGFCITVCPVEALSMEHDG